MRKVIILLAALTLVLTGCAASTGREVSAGPSTSPNNDAAIEESNAGIWGNTDTAGAATELAAPGEPEEEETPMENSGGPEMDAGSGTEGGEPDTQEPDLPVTETDELCVGQAKEIFEATNAERVAAGLPELIWSDELAVAADIRAEEIITNFDHVRPDGTKCYVLSDLIHGENIARGPHASGQEYVSGWMGSEGHRENILREQYTLMGVGTRYTEYGDTAVQIFGFYD